jgi:hypothetical protein
MKRREEILNIIETEEAWSEIAPPDDESVVELDRDAEK